ncbi:TetR family transcriptional regulator [Halarcobacter anaerophilus]|uniref:TetR family transcriptional regulator n=1 Tax=Halarcobacter anaerophilus TaxID=877500 RepID=UPI001163A813|nr:TetR family transcriptional regulator [Halarcobacter anaerophilus]QDF27727.1 transcriptional regulator, TetR/AcrR family [Halarcobacter anaerophilus]
MKRKITKKINKIKKELYLKEIVKYIDSKGYKNFKISELAVILETSIGTIYNLFNSKDELYLEYLLLKFENFLNKLNENKGDDPMENLRLYLKYKYEIFIHIDESKDEPITNDPFFFHKLDVANHPVVIKLYEFLQEQFKVIFNDGSINHIHLPMLFKKLSDGYIESYLFKKYDTSNIVEDTLNHFFYGLKKV